MRKSRTTPFKIRVKKYKQIFGWVSSCAFIASTILLIMSLMESKFKKEYATVSFIYFLISVTFFLSIAALIGYISMVIVSKRHK